MDITFAAWCEVNIEFAERFFLVKLWLWMLGFGFDMSERMSKDMSERCQKEYRKICQKECQQICQRMSEDISEDMSERMSKDMSERTSEDCFQSVCEVESNRTHFRG